MAGGLFEVLMLVVVICLVVVDILSTYVAVAHLGFQEGNPIMRFLISRYGFTTAFSLSLMLIALMIFLTSVLSPGILRVVLAVIATAYSVIVLFNIAQILVRIILD
jgi:hypothetical protein